MKTIKSLKEAQALFPDAVKLKLRIDSPTTGKMVRKLIPESVTIIFCKISKNYVSIIYSKMAKEQYYPDVTQDNETVRVGDHFIHVYRSDDSIHLTTSFCPSSYPEFIRALEGLKCAQLESIINYEETDMGYLKLTADGKDARESLCALLPDLLAKHVGTHSPVPLLHIGTKLPEQ